MYLLIKIQRYRHLSDMILGGSGKIWKVEVVPSAFHPSVGIKVLIGLQLLGGFVVYLSAIRPQSPPIRNASKATEQITDKHSGSRSANQRRLGSPGITAAGGEEEG